MIEENDPDTRSERRARNVREAAERARQEAAARKAQTGDQTPSAPERGGRNGPEPVRYGDWEVKGLATDF